MVFGQIVTKIKPQEMRRGRKDGGWGVKRKQGRGKKGRTGWDIGGRGVKTGIFTQSIFSNYL